MDVPSTSESATSPSSFPWRAVAVGIPIGILICIANVYFGLQTGSVSTMVLPSTLMGFAIFKILKPVIKSPLTAAENVVLQTTASSLGGMPLTAGFTGFIPAMEYLMGSSVKKYDLKDLFQWSLGVCLFGVVYAIPLRRHFILREHLPFPSGTASAVVLGVLHDKTSIALRVQRDRDMYEGTATATSTDCQGDRNITAEQHAPSNRQLPWQQYVLIVAISFSLSCINSMASYFFPLLDQLPVFGTYLANEWLWSIAVSLPYVGYGMIMSPATVAHVFSGTILGWGILAPLAKTQGWAPGPVGDWDTGSQGWLVWISLAATLGDSFVMILWWAMKSIKSLLKSNRSSSRRHREGNSASHRTTPTSSALVPESDDSFRVSEDTPFLHRRTSNPQELSRPARMRSSQTPTTLIWLLIALTACLSFTHGVFGVTLPLYATLIAIVMTYPLSFITTYGLGETDYLMASKISKISQFLFSLIIPSSNPGAILINMAMGGITEAGTWQSSDLMSDFKTAHLIGQDPLYLFYAQIIGSVIGAFTSAVAYRVFTSVYTIPSDTFRVPSAHLWLSTADLVYGKGLPEKVGPFCLGAFLISACCAASRTIAQRKWWKVFIPNGIAVAIGIFIVPSFTLPQGLGGVVALLYYRRYSSSLALISCATGFILGGAVGSIASLLLNLLNTRL